MTRIFLFYILRTADVLHLTEKCIKLLHRLCFCKDLVNYGAVRDCDGGGWQT